MSRLFALLLAACSLPVPQPEAPQLRSFDLRPGQASRLIDPLNHLFHERLPGRALEGPGGALLVVAPPSVLDSVASLVERLDAAPSVPERDVLVEYWIVRGQPAPSAERGEGLDVLSASLDEIQRVDGPLSLTLEARRQLRSRDGAVAVIEGEVEVRQNASVSADGSKIVADIHAKIDGEGEVDTRLTLRAGQIAVLSQGAYSGETPAWMYILVRPTIVE